ncbi:polyprotein [Plakobranchus ocellatus]|uniref:Polyprotein n=1 Tax=Plakobranchus ocellatus TaxID=259542 RepID=A0AAV3ZP27_9GAST|nr:polyprotein [Plakobranchus ocellatus]
MVSPVYTYLKDPEATTVESIETKINRFTRKCLGIPLGLTDVALYFRKVTLRFPLKSIVEDYKCGQVRLMTTLEGSENPAMRSIQPQLRTGRKSKDERTVNQQKRV